jgi:hypothetical protein
MEKPKVEEAPVEPEPNKKSKLKPVRRLTFAERIAEHRQIQTEKKKAP